MANPFMYQGGGCPFFNSGDSNDEPFGWSKGTVRGMITLWTTLGFFRVSILIINIKKSKEINYFGYKF